MADRIRVLIVDDHAVVRNGLASFLGLREDIELVGEAGDGEEAVAKARELSPDVVLMDLVMPGVDGVEATRTLRETCPSCKVLVLTSFLEDDKLVQALRSGAAGYLMKDAEPDRLAEAIREVHADHHPLGEAVAARLMRLVGEERTRPQGTVTIAFTDIEGSTALLQRLGEERARALFREHDRLIRETVAEHAGLEVEHPGDGFMLAFSSARQAVACALHIQKRLATLGGGGPDGGSGAGLRVRIGLNTGEVIAEEHGYFGKSVFVASRVASLAAGGEVLVAELTRALAGPEEFDFEDRGVHALKGLPGTHRLFEVRSIGA